MIALLEISEPWPTSWRQTGVDNGDAPQPTTAKGPRISATFFFGEEQTYVKGVVRRLGLIDFSHLG